MDSAIFINKVMHPYIFNKFEEILTEKTIYGPVLEIGAIPSEKTLLNLPILREVKEKIGINLDGPYTYKDFIIHQCDANKMDIFPDNYFGLVLCNAMLEHDKFFWLTIAEIKRVIRPGGLVVIGTPGYAENSFQKYKNKFNKYSWYRKLSSVAVLDFIFSSTLTYEVHGESFGDFYRFSPAAYREIFFCNYINVNVIQVMQPPRIIGIGFKPIE